MEHKLDTNLDHVHGFAVLDLDHDGVLDVIASEYEGAGRLIAYLNRKDTWQANVMGTDALHNLRAAVDRSGNEYFLGVASYGINPVMLYSISASPQPGDSADAPIPSWAYWMLTLVLGIAIWMRTTGGRQRQLL
jgi:hypothetical protein